MTTGAGPVARRHHTVPQFYLRGFARDEQIATVVLPGDRRFVQSIKDASVVKDYYLLDGHASGADVLEKALSGVEGEAAAILKSIADGVWPLPRKQRETLGYFISLQSVRVPVRRHTSDYLAAQLVRLEVGVSGKAGLRQRLEAHDLTITDERLEELWHEATRPEGPPVRRSPHQHMQEMLELSEHLVKYILGRPWLLVNFERRSLITSDAPVGLISGEAGRAGGVGYATAWGITFPLTRKLGLLMSSPEPAIELKIPVETLYEGNADSRQVGTTELANLFNMHTAAHASQWVFHHPDDARSVPSELPAPRPVNMTYSAQSWEFDGEPWFSGAGVNPGAGQRASSEGGVPAPESP